MKKKNSILIILLTLILSLTIISCSGKNKEITADKATTIGNEMLELSNKYASPQNTYDSADGATAIEIYDEDLKDIGISYGNDPLLTKSTSLIVKMKVKDKNFKLEDYPKYKEAFEIYYGADSTKPSRLVNEIKARLKEVTIEKPAKLSPYKEEYSNISGAITANSDNTYEVLLVCSDDY